MRERKIISSKQKLNRRPDEEAKLNERVCVRKATAAVESVIQLFIYCAMLSKVLWLNSKGKHSQHTRRALKGQHRGEKRVFAATLASSRFRALASRNKKTRGDKMLLS